MPPYPYNTANNFDPRMVATYTVDQLIGFMETQGLTLQDINKVRGVSLFSTDDLVKILVSGKASMEDLRSYGIPEQKIRELKDKISLANIRKKEWDRAKAKASATGSKAPFEEFLANFPQGLFTEEARLAIQEIADDQAWYEACQSGTLGSYALYMKDFPSGRHIDEANQAFSQLKQDEANLIKDLLEDMRQNSWNYPASKMRQLLYGSDTLSTGSFAGAATAANAATGSDVASQFIAKGLCLDFQTLIDNNIIPADFTEEMVIADDYSLPQTTDFSSFPTDRSDVFFLGAPRSGKSTVLSGLFYTMNREGRWRHQICRDKNTGTDSSIDYYNGLLKAVAEHKSPVSTQTDTISYISMDVPVGRDADANPGRNKDMARLNFVELSGEAVKSLANSLSPGVSGTGVWQNLGASRIMQNNNKKVLFFLLDYNVILGHQSGYSAFDQELTLSTALQVLTHDGRGKDFTQGCTMSKVESVAVILTKADLMGTTDRNERREIAFSYLKENFKAFMNSLTDCCHRYNINSAMSHLPYIFTFSVGKFYVGNTMEFDSTDSLELANIIQDLAPYSRTGIFG